MVYVYYLGGHRYGQAEKAIRKSFGCAVLSWKIMKIRPCHPAQSFACFRMEHKKRTENWAIMTIIFSVLFPLQDSKDLEFSRDHFYKFMLVRHPMERLVSCYFDKMVNGTHKSLKGFRRLVKTTAKAIRERRRVKSNDNGRRPLGSYPKSNPFLGFKNSKKRLARNASSSESMEQKGGVIPTLDDFLEYILTDLSGEGFSSHWVPYWRMCTPCHFKYDMILKLESGFDDFTVNWKEFFFP